MKVLLLKDVYKLGHAGDVKKVADGYGRNYLIPRGLAALATAGAVKQAETLRTAATKLRQKLNTELSGLAERINGTKLYFPAKAGETGKLYGSITMQNVTDALNKELDTDVDRHKVVHQPLRELGTYKVPVRLTADLIAHIVVMVHREGQSPEAPEAPAPAVVEPVVEAANDAAVVEEDEAPAAEAAA
jgi:large subunit ribosomal protein L9